MMYCCTRAFCVPLAVMLFSGPVWAQLSDKNVYVPPNYTSMQPPAAGLTYVDPVFRTTILRVSDALNQANADRGGNLVFVTDEYSTMSPFNKDNSRFLVQCQSYYALFDGSGRFIRNLSFDVNTSSEPRWSRQEANVFYYVHGNQLKKYNTDTSAITLVHSFTQYSSVSGKGESDICFDGNHFVLVGNNRYVFVYEISTDRIGTVLDTGGRPFDSVYITPNDKVTITWLASGTSRYSGIELFDRNMNFLRQLSSVGGHMDVTRDANGDEVLILTNSADPAPRCDNAIVKIRLADGQQTCLLSLDWNLAVHISAPDNNGWCFVETYAPSDPTLPPSWTTYTNELLQVKLDGSQVRRLAHHRSRPFNSYNYQPRLSVSRDGSRLLYNSNFGLQSTLGYPTEYSDVYMMTVPGATATPPGPVLPAVTISATDNTATENPLTTGSLTVTRTGSTAAALTVYYSVSGTATPGTDYSRLPGSITIPAGLSTAKITVTPVNDTLVESNETVVVTLAASAACTPGSPAVASVTISSDDQNTADIILDNAAVGQSGGGRSFSGTWCLSTSTGSYGSDSLYSCGSGGDTYRWTPTMPSAGRYAVYVRWTAHANRSTSVPISVTHAGGITTRSFNEQSGGAQWVLHGTYSFNAGTAGYVQVSDAYGQAAADAVRFVRVSTAAEIILDNAAAGQSATGRSFTGTWCLSASTGYFGLNALYSCGSGTDTYRWTPAIPTAGNYQVYVWWTAHANRSTAVPIAVTHASGTTTRSFNEQTGGSQWVLHGTYGFNAGSSGFVQTSDPNGQACADAIRLVRVP